MSAREICPPDHKHGETLTCYQLHLCGCDECRQASTENKYWWEHMRAAGRLDALDLTVPATGTRRRIEALMAVGWSQGRIAEHAGTDQARISGWARATRVRRSTHNRIVAVYELLADQTPSTDTRETKTSVTATLALAARRGYARPIDWDDIDNDPAPSMPVPIEGDVDDVAVQLVIDGTPLRVNRAERHLVVVALHARGYSDRRIAERVLRSVKTIERDREALELPAAVDHAGERIAS